MNDLFQGASHRPPVRCLSSALGRNLQIEYCTKQQITKIINTCTILKNSTSILDKVRCSVRLIKIGFRANQKTTNPMPAYTIRNL